MVVCLDQVFPTTNRFNVPLFDKHFNQNLEKKKVCGEVKCNSIGPTRITLNLTFIKTKEVNGNPQHDRQTNVCVCVCVLMFFHSDLMTHHTAYFTWQHELNTNSQTLKG